MRPSRLFLCTCLTSLAFPAMAQDAPRPALKPRVEANLRAGTERSIAMSEFWVPLAQDAVQGSVLYGDARFMGDDKENNEFNLGVGYREIVTDVPVLGNGVAGVHGWVDRRHTERGAAFNQITAGAEWHGEVFDIKANAYIPLNKSKTHAAGTTTTAPYLAGSGIFYDITNMKLIEEAQPGFDLELGLNVSGIVDGFADSARIYAGAYHFSGDKSDDVTGWRTRIASDITQDVQIGARFQRDDERGSQGFLEATIRFPFGNKQSYKQHGLYARLDESPERDIDIVTSATRPAPASAPVVTPVLNATSGDVQRVLYVDNSAAGGGTGTLNNPFNSLADAQADLRDNDVVYVARGDGLTTNMTNGFTINRSGVSLIGEGSAFVYDGGKFTAADANFSGTVLKAAGLAPTITNAGANAITIAANNAFLSGITVSGARNGIVVDANNISAQNITITDISAINNDWMGIYLHGYNGGSLSAAVQRTVMTGNGWHGMSVYDDTANMFEVDLGGGGRSAGRNTLAGNTLEDLALDYDGRTIAAMNNWWGQAAGPYQAAPAGGLRPQIYYGAPINDGLVGHWTFDTEWMSGTTAFDRSGNGYNGTLGGGLTLANAQAGQHGQSLSFDGVDDGVTIAANATLNALISTYSVVAVSRLNPAAVGAQNALYASGASDQNYWEYYIQGSGGNTLQQARNDNGGSVGSAHQLTRGLWVQTALVRSGNGADNIAFYEDGAAQGTASLGIVNSNGTKAIGRRTEGNSHNFMGEIDDVRIYNRAVSANEIAELHRMSTDSIVNFGGFMGGAP